MKKVFEAHMILEFGSMISSNNFQKIYPFVSSNGITGDVVLSEVSQNSDKSLKVNVSVMTNRKRMFPDFEAYLELIKGVIGERNQNSISKLSNIELKTIRTLDLCKEISQYKDYKIVEDEDSIFYVINENHLQKVLNCFESIQEAEEFLKTK